MGAIAVKTVMEHWCYVAPLLLLPQTEDDYNALVEALDTVLDAGGADENHPLAALADRMGELVAQYEDAHLPHIPATIIDQLVSDFYTDVMRCRDEHSHT